MRADLASRAAWAPFHLDFDAGEEENPELVEGRAIDAGSNIPRTFDRLSLALDRVGHPSAAVQVCEIGLARFSNEARRSRIVQQIEKRGERCRTKADLVDPRFSR